MVWKLEIDKKADKLYRKLDPQSKQRITKFLNKNLIECDNPRAIGKPLTGSFSGKWRYRVDDYRILCTLNDAEKIITITKIAHRRKAYFSILF